VTSVHLFRHITTTQQLDDEIPLPVFRDLPIVTMIIWTFPPQNKASDESSDTIRRRIVGVIPLWSSWPITTREESEHTEWHISYTIDRDRLTIDGDGAPTVREAANSKTTLHLNAPIHSRSPTKSQKDIQVNSVRKSAMKFTYNCIRHPNGRDQSTLAEKTQPNRPSLPAEKRKKGRTRRWCQSTIEDHFCQRWDQITILTNTM